MNLVRKNGPFIESKLSTGKIMRNIFIALIPIILYTFYLKGIIPFQEAGNILDLMWIFITLAITTSVSFITEILYQLIFTKRRKKEDLIFDIKHNYSFMTGIMVGLLLPYGVNILVMVIASLSATVIGKLFFGGFGSNTFNPPLIGILIVILIFGGSYSKLSQEYNYKEACNEKAIFDLCAEEPYLIDQINYTDYTIYDTHTSPADISPILCIIACCFLIITKSTKWRIPVFYLSTAFIISIVFGLIHSIDFENSIECVICGGLLFYAVFVATDSVTTPVTKTGQILLGISLGVLTMFFRLVTPYFYEATIFSILILNMFTRLYDMIGFNLKQKKSIIILPSVILLILTIIPFAV